MRGCFVSGTDTGAGKSVVAAAIVAALRSRGVPVTALKPVVTGLDDPQDGWPPDHELLASVSGAEPDTVAPLRYGPAVSPHLAAELGGEAIEIPVLRQHLAAALAAPGALVVEGVGGLLVPLTDTYSVRELASDAGLPLVIAARPGLGTINHTLLTLEAARSAELPVAGVVLTPWPAAPGEIERSNRATIERLGEVEVAVLPWVKRPEQGQLASAGALLPLDRWLR